LTLCNRNSAQGISIKKDVSQHPIHVTAGNISTWQTNGIRVFKALSNVEIEQGDLHVVADNVIIWFKEVKIGQLVEGNMEVYCKGDVTILQEDNIQEFEEAFLELVTTAGVAISPTDVKIPIKSFEEEQKAGLYSQAEMFKAKEKGEPYEGGISTGIAAEGEPIDVTADDIDTWIENDVRVIVATGNVKIKRNNETLNADNIILYFDQEKEDGSKSPKQIYKEFYAEGNVTLRRDDDTIIADRIFENIQEKKGIFTNSTVSSALKPPIVMGEMPVYLKGEEIKHTKGNYEINNGGFTHCSYGHPHFHFKFSKLRVIKNEDQAIASAKKNVFYAGKVPLIYLPFLNFNLKKGSDTKRLQEWETGTTSRFGRFFKTDWNVYAFAGGEKMSKWSNLIFSADTYSLRGPAAGLDFDYKKPNYFGYMNTYYINDDEDFDINNVPVETENRGHFLWRHRHTLFDDWIADIEIAHVRDRSYYREYYQPEFKLKENRNTLLYLRKLSGNRGITFLAEHQLRTYDTLIDSVRLSRKNESLPELKYSIIGEPLWGGRLNLTSETEATYQNRVFDRISPLRSAENFLGRGELLTAERVFDRGPVRLEPEETIRFDTSNVINAPFRILGQRFNPFIGIRFTGYSESVSVSPVTGDNKGGGTARGRVAVPIGLNTSRTLSRTYSIYNKLLNINRLRHIMVPELALNFIPIVTQNPEDLNQFDGIDAIDKYQSVKFRFRNRLQTKRGEPGKEETVNLVDLDTELNLFPGSSGLNRKRDDYIKWDLKVQLTDKISFISEGNEFNLGRGGVDIFNTSLNYRNTPKWNFSVGSRYIDNISSTVNFSSTVLLNEKWSVTFYEQYAFRTEEKDQIGRGSDSENQSLNTGAVINRYFHDWIARMTISQIGTRDDDNIVMFNLIPRGLEAITNRQRTVGAFLPQQGR
jgi:lipopolysaccharide assembly outer membrane protein LptD (OstA)